MTILKILYAERNCDEKLGSKILEDSTAYLGAQNIFCAFTVVSNGFNALECFEHTKFNIVFLEKDLGDGLDGDEVLNILRSSGITTPVILLTSSTDENEQVNSTGFQSVMQRPLSLECLEACIFKFCDIQKEPTDTTDNSPTNEIFPTPIEKEAYANLFLSMS
mmetsp:Transcript_5415/g.8000  ORF Transcript_5415/g.8000 Transcript_5415/m.8000 type:complete len:163 (+) Transcript_5415:94-582(+)|eukprot:CAMPEP_0170072768 /NCGR_PEP_ID=MMETSP0019_2-20121128/10334_1 /TAXON_ID=98059 /ORGANISM="Dinobryon sp., Strain UTEXLB2267" /LENGTH=162 /DNA_ID=CAMNT_0010281925 /DNA_START=79 /DNA_END=567 /DNA_ORIENTATION=-